MSSISPPLLDINGGLKTTNDFTVEQPDFPNVVARDQSDLPASVRAMLARGYVRRLLQHSDPQPGSCYARHDVNSAIPVLAFMPPAHHRITGRLLNPIRFENAKFTRPDPISYAFFTLQIPFYKPASLLDFHTSNCCKSSYSSISSFVSVGPEVILIVFLVYDNMRVLPFGSFCFPYQVESIF